MISSATSTSASVVSKPRLESPFANPSNSVACVKQVKNLFLGIHLRGNAGVDDCCFDLFGAEIRLFPHSGCVRGAKGLAIPASDNGVTAAGFS